MAYPLYLRERARELRIAKRLSLDEIAARLALPKTTVYYWISNLPLDRPRCASPGRRKGNVNMQAKYRKLREDAYAQGLVQYDSLIELPTFRDFVVLYIAEGYKRNRNRVSIGNSDTSIVEMAAGWLRALSVKSPKYSVQYHVDQDLGELRQFWAEHLGVDEAHIRVQRKSNSGRLNGRVWRSAHGVLTVCVEDTLLRARLQAWIDRVQQDWGLDSAVPGA